MEQQHMFTNRMIRNLLVPVVLEQILNSIMGTADPCPGIWPHGCLDRNVCGLDGTRNHIYMEIPQPQVVGA